MSKKARIAFLVLTLSTLLLASAAVGDRKQSEIKIVFTSPPSGHPLIQFDRLPPEIRDALREVADGYTLYMVAEKVESLGDPFLYEYLFDRLPISALLLRELNLANYNIYEESPNSYHWIDPKGVFGRFKLVYKEPGKRIYYGSGFYDGRLMPRIEGKVIMIFLYRPVQGKNARLMQNRVYSYIEVENFLYSAVAKVLQPILPTVVRGKMDRLFSASKTLSEWIARDPADVYHRIEASRRVARNDLLEFKRAFIENRR